MSFTPEQLATPFGQLAVAVYSPDPPNPAGVTAIQRCLELALAHGVSNGLIIDHQTRDWQAYDASSRTLSGATYWTIGAGVVLGTFSILQDGSYEIGEHHPDRVATISIFQDPAWSPPFDMAPGRGPVSFIFRAINLQGCRTVIDNNLLM